MRGGNFLFSSSDVAPLSAPAFSFCFPLLNAKLRGSSGSTEETENMMTKALQVVMEHCKLRAVGTAYLDFAVDEVDTNLFEGRQASTAHVSGPELKKTNASLFQTGPELLPRVNMLLLLESVISTATPRLQVLPDVWPSFLCLCRTDIAALVTDFFLRAIWCPPPGFGFPMPDGVVCQCFGRRGLHSG